MNEKRRYILGAVTITAVLGFTAYAIYEYKKVSKQMEEAIDINQAKREVEEAEDDGYDEYDEDDEYDIQEYENITGDIEEEEKLLHDPDSLEARMQFIEMKLAEWPHEEGARLMLFNLFAFPFKPTNEEDKLLRKVLSYNREEFFGPDSKHNSEITWADVILHYAENLEFNLGGTINYWTEFMLDNMGIHRSMSSEAVDEMLADLENHTFWNEDDLFGLFGLDDDQLDDAYLIADDQVDPSLTFDIQFNEYLKGYNSN